jgi:hypothetical protein
MKQASSILLDLKNLEQTLFKVSSAAAAAEISTQYYFSMEEAFRELFILVLFCFFFLT